MLIVEARSRRAICYDAMRFLDTSYLLIIWLLQQAPIGWGLDPSRHESARMRLICGRFRDRGVSEMRPPASCDDCAETQIHRGKSALVAPLIYQLVGVSMPTSRTNEPIRPTTCGQIPLAGFLRGKVGLKLAQRFRERGAGHACTLPIGAC